MAVWKARGSGAKGFLDPIWSPREVASQDQPQGHTEVTMVMVQGGPDHVLSWQQKLAASRSWVFTNIKGVVECFLVWCLGYREPWGCAMCIGPELLQGGT